MKVLLVEDDILSLEWMSIFLKSKNLELKTATSVKRAIEWLDDWRPDIIISDVELDGSSAFLLIDHLESDETIADIPVVAMSGFMLAPAQQRGFDGYLIKPIDPERLWKMIQDLTQNSK
ncbi:MAG: hypothetical protein C5B54_05570 [Acidobacteria bacterium]|nr:MAG: hypothetical protein C5B54_05570 [Acidobacteriota bacterium]